MLKMYTLIVAGLLFAGPAFAEDTMSNGSNTTDTGMTHGDAMKSGKTKDMPSTAGTTHDGMAHNGMASDSMKKSDKTDGMGKDSIGHDSMGSNETK